MAQHKEDEEFNENNDMNKSGNTSISPRNVNTISDLIPKQGNIMNENSKNNLGNHKKIKKRVVQQTSLDNSASPNALEAKKNKEDDDDSVNEDEENDEEDEDDDEINANVEMIENEKGRNKEK